MRIRQISVFIENKVGRLAEIARILGDRGVNIRGFSMSETSQYGIFRLVTNSPDEAIGALKDNNFTVTSRDIICVRVQDRPGGLADVLEVLSKAGFNVEYAYIIANTQIALVIDDIDRAAEILQSHGIDVLSEKEVYGA
ncbi:MAG: ACT domain-containing protein [bacterium]